MSAIVIIILSIGIAITFLGWYTSLEAETDRRKAIGQIASTFGFAFFPKGDAALGEALKDFHIFRRGHRRSMRNLLRGQYYNVDISIFDYDCSLGQGENYTSWTESVVCFQFAGPILPTFWLNPKSFQYQLQSGIGLGINMDRYPNFAEHYFLRGINEHETRGIFTKAIVGFYEQNLGISTEGSGRTLLYYRRDEQLHPQAIRSFMESGLKLLTLYRTARQ